MWPILKYILRTGLRDKLYLSIFAFLVCSFSLAIFLGSTSLTEATQTTAAFIAGSSRIIICVGIILFCCLSINRAFENKEVEFILSKAISREQFILAYFFGFALSALLIILPLVLVIYTLVPVNKIGLLAWSLSLFAELLIIVSFATLAALILKNSLSAILSTMAFYLISRLMGIFVLAINLPQDFAQVQQRFLPSLLKIISLFFPRLDLFAPSQWLVYGVDDYSQIKIIVLQSAIYIPLLIFMSLRDFKLKQF